MPPRNDAASLRGRVCLPLKFGRTHIITACRLVEVHIVKRRISVGLRGLKSRERNGITWRCVACEVEITSDRRPVSARRVFALSLDKKQASMAR